MPGFFDIFFRPDEPEPEPVKPKKVKKAAKKAAKKPYKPSSFRHPLKEKVASLEAELQFLRNPEPQVEVTEPEDDDPAE